MKKKNRKDIKIIMGIFTVVLLFISAAACGNEQGQKMNKEKQTEIVRPDPDASPEAEEKSVASDQIVEQGEEVAEMDVDNGEAIPDALLYTIKRAAIYQDISEAGISEDAMQPSYDEDILDSKGKIKPSVKFLVVEMTVKNICALSERNITSFSLLYADSTNKVSDHTSEIDFFDLPLPSYFSNPTGTRVGEDWKQYYDYRLPVGQSKDIKVGWYIDLERYNSSDLYLVFNRDVDKYEKFVRLELE